MIVIFVEFIDQLIDYLINRASLTKDVWASMTDNLPSSISSRKHAYIILTPLNPTFI